MQEFRTTIEALVARKRKPMTIPKPGEKAEFQLSLTCTECEWLVRAVARADQYIVAGDASLALRKFAYATPSEQLKFFKAVAFMSKFLKEEITEELEQPVKRQGSEI
jgi:hypothetical protein